MPATGAFLPVGPHNLGLEVGSDADVTGEGVTRRLRIAPHLHGPRGHLHGGLGAGTLLGAARLADPFGAPPTAVDARFVAPTPLDADLTVRVTALRTAVHEVEVATAEGPCVTGTVTLAGHEVGPRVGDLRSLVRESLPPPVPREQHFALDCWVCGPDNPQGLKMVPGWHEEGRVLVGWAPSPEHTVERATVHPVVVCAVLDCPALWATWPRLRDAGWPVAVTGSLHVRFFGDAPGHEVLRVSALADGGEGRRRVARSALLDEEGTVYAVADATIVAVLERPG